MNEELVKANRRIEELEIELSQAEEMISLLDEFVKDKFGIHYQEAYLEAKVLCYTLNGYMANDIIDKLHQEGIEITQMKVYQILSGQAGRDKEYLRKILCYFPEIFMENEVSEQDVWDWFTDILQEPAIRVYSQHKNW